MSYPTDIVAELRHIANGYSAFDKPVMAKRMIAAADEIERLRAHINKLEG